MKNPICLLRSTWLTLKTGSFLIGRTVSGHDYVLESDTPDCVQVLKCRRCGDVSIAWCWPHQVPTEWIEAKGKRSRLEKDGIPTMYISPCGSVCTHRMSENDIPIWCPPKEAYALLTRLQDANNA